MASPRHHCLRMLPQGVNRRQRMSPTLGKLAHVRGRWVNRAKLGPRTARLTWLRLEASVLRSTWILGVRCHGCLYDTVKFVGEIWLTEHAHEPKLSYAQQRGLVRVTAAR